MENGLEVLLDRRMTGRGGTGFETGLQIVGEVERHAGHDVSRSILYGSVAETTRGAGRKDQEWGDGPSRRSAKRWRRSSQNCGVASMSGEASWRRSRSNCSSS